MERSEFINSIADALTKVTGKETYGLVNSIKDAKFPVYSVHTITLGTYDGKWNLQVTKRVHSKEVDRNSAFKQLIVELLSMLLSQYPNSIIPLQKEELKF